ncbi:MAG: FxDxF family PEP-CTERM protein [Gallionellaceae bacterium]|nr:FxDxF family PEP-CTERM protein [Gallionellaceae bacterium]
MTMQKVLAVALFSAGVFATGLTQAATDLGTVAGSIPTTGFAAPAPGSFADSYVFDIATASSFGGSVTNIAIPSLFNISGLTLSLYDSASNLLATWGTTGGSISLAAADDYSFTVSGNATGAMGGIYSFAVSAQPVPEPGEFALMLSGLGLMGYMVRRRKNNAA